MTFPKSFRGNENDCCIFTAHVKEESFVKNLYMNFARYSSAYLAQAVKQFAKNPPCKIFFLRFYI
jgi:hypothetical protein